MNTTVCIDDMFATDEALKAMFAVCKKLNIVATYVNSDIKTFPVYMAFTMSEEDATVFKLTNGKELVWKEFLAGVRG